MIRLTNERRTEVMLITPEELSVWNSRWYAQKARLDALESTLGDPKIVIPRKATLYSLVKRLRSFAEGQFCFFHDGFGATGNLEQVSGFPPEYVLRATLEQITFDLDVVERAMRQRRSPDANTLGTADSLAWSALKPAVDANLIRNDYQENPTVVTYLKKSPSIRIIPYAPVALIGIPFTVTSVPQDYLAIPHEIGHYVFRNGKPNDVNQLRQIVAERVASVSPQYIVKWVEEIFSDVYGGKVGGPVMGLDFQDLQLEELGEKFTTDDGEHPVPVARPYIYSSVLDSIGAYPNARAKLNARWQAKLNGRGNPLEFDRSTGGQTSLNVVISRMNDVIAEIIPILPDPANRWSNELGPEDDVIQLYDRFNNAFIQSLANQVVVPEAAWGDFDYAIWRNNRFFEGADIDKRPEIPAGTKEDLPEAPNGTWIHVLNAGGWTTRGPQGSN
jgi:hypothetical protein